MIDLLEESLKRLLGSSGADVAVIWSRAQGSSAGSVICTNPVGLLEPGTAWPSAAHCTPAVVHRDPVVVARLVPTSLLLELPAAATAALWVELGEPDLVLLLIWCGTQVAEQLSEEARRSIGGEISALARVAALLNEQGRTAMRLQAVVADLTQGVVSVNHALDEVTMNPAAARLLNLPPGKIGASDFAAAMATLEGRALNREEVTSMGQRLLADPWSHVDCTWLFATEPTHVRVTSRAIRHGTFSERVWVFDDVSQPARALHASEAAEALLRATADSMLDPQVLLEAVRDPGGRVIDFRYLSVNRAACTYLGLHESDLVGHTQLEASPNLEGSEIHQRYIQCLADGEPVILDDFSFFNEILDDARRYDIRATRAGADRISLTWSDVTERFAAAQRVVEAQALLRATGDSMLDPQMLLEGVRDPAGRVVDLRYREANEAACLDMAMTREELVGRTVLELLPGFAETGPMAYYVQCLETGQPGTLEEYSYDNEIHADSRRYDIRIAPAGSNLISLTFRDVTERFVAAQRVAEAQALLHATVDGMLNPQVLFAAVRDPAGEVIDFVYRTANRATSDYLGVEERDLVGQSALATLPNLEGSGLLERYRECVETGLPVVLDDFSYFNEILDDGRRYDIRATRAGVDLISLTFSDVTERFHAAQRIVEAQALLHATVDSMLNPQVLLEAVRDPAGRVVDFMYRSANRAACSYRGLEEQDMVGRSALELQPDLMGSGLLWRYADCVDSGEALVLDDFAFLEAVHVSDRRYDIRVTRAGVDLISLTYSDVTERFVAAQRIAESEQNYRLIAENSSDMVNHVRDGRFAWVSPSVEAVLGAPPEHWVGRPVRDIIPDRDAPEFAVRLKTLNAGGSVKERIRVVAVDGVTHWVHLHAKPFHDAEGRQDGFTAALRLADDEVAAEQAAEEARKEKAQADALHRRSIDNAAVGMCRTTPEGRFDEVNAALCAFFGYDEATLKQLDWQELTAPEYLEADEVNVGKIMAGEIDSYRLTKQFLHAHGHRIWGELSVSCLRRSGGDVEWFIAQITDITDEVEQRQRYQLLAENVGDIVMHLRDGIIVWISPSVEAVLGGSPDYWIGRSPEGVLPREAVAQFVAAQSELAEGRSVQERIRLVALDGITSHWMQVHSKPFYTAAGHPDGFTAAMRVIDDEVAAEREVEKAREQQTRSDALYRRLMDSSPIGMTISNPDGRYVAVNQAVCEIFGYSEAELLQMTWKDVTVAENIEPGVYLLREIFAGRLDTFEFTGQQARRDNVERWSKVGISCLRAPDGTVEHLIGQIVDVTAETIAQRELTEQSERNRVLAQSLQQKTDRITSELDSAATYMDSIMPRGLHGTVEVSSRYLPSAELGGDCFDYTWIDDDHLLVYLIDISGHGIEPALLSVSVHNMLRSGVFDVETLLEPATVVTELNRLFQMEQQNDHFFTLWLGVYEASTRTLCYSNAGANPVFVFEPPDGSAIVATELPTLSVPVGMLDDAVFTSQTYAVPPNCQMLIFSDGANELKLPDGQEMSLADFKNVATGVAGSPDWSLDDLTAQLHAMKATPMFDDDCSLILLTFP